MRRLVLVLLSLLTGSSVFASTSFVRVWGSYRTADSFVRISEYFTGQEVTRRKETLLRTQPKERGGYYFLCRLENTDRALSGAKLELRLVTSASPRPAVYTFPIEVPHGQHVYDVGLTGSDWPKLDEEPVAWHIALLGADGTVLASKQSYLWSKSDGGT